MAKVDPEGNLAEKTGAAVPAVWPTNQTSFALAFCKISLCHMAGGA